MGINLDHTYFNNRCYAYFNKHNHAYFDNRDTPIILFAFHAKFYLTWLRLRPPTPPLSRLNVVRVHTLQRWYCLSFYFEKRLFLPLPRLQLASLWVEALPGKP